MESTGGPPDNRGPALFLVALALVALILVAAGLGNPATVPGPPQTPSPTVPTGAPPPAPRRPPPAEDATPSAAAATLPGGGTRIFQDRFLVAYYGTAGTGALGVLGETDPDTATRRLRRAARPFHAAGPAGERIQLVHELIVTVADPTRGRDGDFSHDIGRALVRRHIAAARRNGVLLLLDLQPGRADFLSVAKRWEWALRDPWVGLALDPEWRMGRRETPGRVIGSVGAAEVNRTAAWLSGLVARHALPEKLFVLHQFRTSMLRHPQRIESRPGLAMVRHVDGFGTPRQKRATYAAVAGHGGAEVAARFTMGFKLFYDEDVRLMRADAVRRLRPRVRFVSYQ